MITERSTKSFQGLIYECKKYINLQKEYLTLELIEKLSAVFSTLILILVVVILGMVVLFYLSFSLAYLLEPHVGGLTNSYLIISGIILLIALLVYFLRKQLIITPILNFIAKLFYNDSNK